MAWTLIDIHSGESVKAPVSKPDADQDPILADDPADLMDWAVSAYGLDGVRDLVLQEV